MRVGGTTTLKVDVRVIAASNKDLLEEVSKSAFREDLYYRLNVLPIVIPPLRDRRDDIPLLVDFFLGKECQGRERKKITPKALKCLMSHRWPGNVRELENTVELLQILVPGNTILPEHIPDAIRNIRTS
jgi:two-component system nitrogen regulation response regulator NtrX